MSSILIKGGTIIDGTGKSGFESDVLIENDRIKDIRQTLGPNPQVPAPALRQQRFERTMGDV